MGATIISIAMISLHLIAQSYAYRINGEYIAPPEMPMDCVGFNFCQEMGDLYPNYTVSQLVPPHMEKMRAHMSMDPSIVGMRHGTDGFCSSTSNTAPVYYIVDTLGNTRVVVQQPDVFEQVYETKYCDNEGLITDGDKSNTFLEMAKSLSAVCETKYNQVDFLVLSKDFTYIEQVKIKDGLPVNCYCRYEKSNHRF